jgi:hypothetical protein
MMKPLYISEATMFDFILSLTIQTAEKVWLTLLHNWPFLLSSILIAAWLNQSFDAERMAAILRKRRRAGVVAATGVAVATPLCSCGTTAIVLGMMANLMPWAPIVAFMVASPLTSPGELFYSAGLFGWAFALAFYIASILLGLAGGWATSILESRGWLENQVRFKEGGSQATAKTAEACGCSSAPAPEPAACGCSSTQLSSPLTIQPFSPVLALATADCCRPASQAHWSETRFLRRAAGRNQVSPLLGFDWQAYRKQVLTLGPRLLAFFLGFAFIGYFLNGLIPASWVSTLFGSGHVYSVPLAATLGLPFYINTEASLPLVRALLDAGMSPGAALAFMISGAGTSIGAVGGALTIARWRVVGLVIGTLWAGAILCGLAYDVLLSTGLL